MTHEIYYTGPIKDIDGLIVYPETVEHLGKTYTHRGNFHNGHGRWCSYYTIENEQGEMTADLYAYDPTDQRNRPPRS